MKDIYGRGLAGAYARGRERVVQIVARREAYSPWPAAGKDLVAPGSVDQDTLRWLTSTPAGDGNFRSHLSTANAATCRAALEFRSLSKTARRAIERRLRKIENNQPRRTHVRTESER